MTDSEVVEPVVAKPGSKPVRRPPARAKPAPRQKVRVFPPPVVDEVAQAHQQLEQWRQDEEFLARLEERYGPVDSEGTLKLPDDFEDADKLVALLDRRELEEKQWERRQFAMRKRAAALDAGEGLTPWQRKLREEMRSPDQQRQPEGTVDQLVAQNAMLLERLERLERGNAQFVQAEPPPKPEARIADDAELTDWQRSLRRETHLKDPATMIRNEPGFNVPHRYYMRPDGDIVALQADSANLALYTDTCGFRVLSADEERHYLKVERPRIVKLQQQHASLINGIRAAVARDVTLQVGLPGTWEADLDKMTIPEKQALFDEIANTPTADGKPRRMFKRLERLQSADDARADAEAKQMLSGVEMNQRRMEDLDRLTGYDRPRTPRTRSSEVELTPQNAGLFASSG